MEKQEKHFPTDFSDREIRARIEENINKAGNKKMSLDSEALFQLTLQMSQLGQSELNLRYQKRLGKVSKRLSGVSIGLAIVTIFLAGITIWYSQRDMESDQKWRDDQMIELKKMNEFHQEQIQINEELNGNILKLLEKPVETVESDGKNN